MPGKEFIGQRTDDLPLRRVGILRLVHQDMIELPVQLVADPFGQRAAGQQFCRLADLVVEIDEPSAGLGLVPGQGELAPHFQGRDKEVDQFEQGLAFLHRQAAVEHGKSRFLKTALQRCEPVQVLDLPLLPKQFLVQFIEAGQPLFRTALQPQTNKPGNLAASCCVPCPVSRKAVLQRVGIEHPVAAEVEQVLWPGIGGQAQQAQHAVAHGRLPATRPDPGIARSRTAQQPGGNLVRPHPHRQPRQSIQGGRIVGPLCRQQQVSQNLAQQQVLVAILHRPHTGQQPRLVGEGREQPLRKGVDRIDPEAPARAVEHGGKQLAGAGNSVRAMIGANRQQVLGQGRAVQPHPARQHLVDAGGHFGCPGLGKSQAQDLVGPHALFQQQPQHAG